MRNFERNDTHDKEKCVFIGLLASADYIKFRPPCWSKISWSISVMCYCWFKVWNTEFIIIIIIIKVMVLNEWIVFVWFYVKRSW